MDKRNNDFDFDFKPIGKAIKAAHKAQGMTREQLVRIVDYDPRHLQAIENEGQYPSLELFIQLVTRFGVSVDINNRQFHMEDYLQMVSAEQKEYAEVVLLLVTFPRFVYIYPIDIYR